jgi:glycosyltransferase involved in cell wall biosynthesis
MSHEDNASGVDRYINMLLYGLENYPFIQVYRIRFLAGRILFHQEEKKKNHTHVIIPMPQQTGEIISERYWFRKYDEHVFQLIRHLFENKPNRIIHIHTLNLISLASYIKSQLPCKIITHLHCIPWKDFYNKNQKKFNQLYSLYRSEKNTKFIKEPFFSNNCEYESYTASDKIICVTQCAKDFLKKVMEIPEKHIEVISNGMNDIGNHSENRMHNMATGVFYGLFVGILSEGKGTFYILKALRKVQKRGYSVCLNMAGTCSPAVRKQITEKYSDLRVNILGQIPFEELQSLYRESHFGIIASLQEQCSYAAIEMMAFGLPVVTTAVDGLDEIFTDGLNALKVNTRFSKVFGLSVDTDMLADKIIALIENDDLRERLGINARELYLKKFTLEQMMQQTINVYKRILNE